MPLWLQLLRVEIADALIAFAVKRVYPSSPAKVRLVATMREHYRQEGLDAAAMGCAAWTAQFK